MIAAPTEQLYLGTTALQELFLCLAKFDYHQNQRLIPKPSRIRYTMRRGIWLHACLQHHYEGKDWRDVVDVLVQWAEQNGVKPEQIEQAKTEVASIMTDYLLYYAKTVPWKPIAAEKAIDLAFPAIGLTLRPTIDCLAEWEGGYWLIEYKSTQDIPGAMWRAIDPQTALQWVAVENYYNIRLEGILFDYLYTIAPRVPEVTKGVKAGKNGPEFPRFHANAAVTCNRLFGQGVEKLKLAYDTYHNGNGWESDAQVLRQFNEYVAAARTRLVNDNKFFVRQISKRPEAQLLTTMKDIRVKVEEARLAHRLGHWPHSFNQKVCKMMCDYYELCAQEYVGGHQSLAIREELFTVDTGEREGRIELPAPGGVVHIDENWNDDSEGVY